MAAFDDPADPEIGSACNRLAAWVESMAADAVVDPVLGLSERDLALILRHLHATRRGGADGVQRTMTPSTPSTVRPSVPITVRDDHR